MARYASRKFLVSIFVLISALWLRLEGLIDATDYVKLAIAVLALYGAANVAQKAMAKDGSQQPQ